MTEQEVIVRPVARPVVDQQRVTAELRRRHCIEFRRVAVVAVRSQQELEVECCELRQSGFVVVLGVDLRLRFCEKFVVVLPENCPAGNNRLEALSVEMVIEFTGEVV